MRYTSAVIATDPAAPPPDDANQYVPSGYPGARAPHVADGAGSLFDRFGKEFTLLCLGDPAPGAQWRDAALALGVPLDIMELADPAVRALYGADLVLIRPDHHVAWRGDSTALPQAALRLATGQ